MGEKREKECPTRPGCSSFVTLLSSATAHLSGSDENSLMETSDQSRKHCLIGILALLSYRSVSVPDFSLILGRFSPASRKRVDLSRFSARIAPRVSQIQTLFRSNLAQSREFGQFWYVRRGLEA